MPYKFGPIPKCQETFPRTLVTLAAGLRMRCPRAKVRKSSGQFDFAILRLQTTSLVATFFYKSLVDGAQ